MLGTEFCDVHQFLLNLVCLYPLKTLQKNLKVAPRIEKTKVFRKGLNFANRTYFASCIMRKHCFLLWTKETTFFSYFYLGIMFYCAELFDCAVNLRFYLNIFIFLNKNTNQNQRSNIWIKMQPLISGSAIQRGFGNKMSGLQFHRCFTNVFEDFGHIFPTCFCRTSHNLVCNKLAILKNKKTC